MSANELELQALPGLKPTVWIHAAESPVRQEVTEAPLRLVRVNGYTRALSPSSERPEVQHARKSA